MFRQCRLPTLAMALFVAAPALAQDAPAMSATDRSAIDRITTAFFDKLRTGQHRPAIDAFFTGNALVAGKDNELQILASQIATAVGVIGPMSQCEMVERDNRGRLVERELFLCQHDKALVRWSLTMIRLPAGWTGLNVSFDDKVTATFN